MTEILLTVLGIIIKPFDPLFPFYAWHMYAPHKILCLTLSVVHIHRTIRPILGPLTRYCPLMPFLKQRILARQNKMSLSSVLSVQN